jgi:hypothetical protein
MVESYQEIVNHLVYRINDRHWSGLGQASTSHSLELGYDAFDVHDV